MQQQMQQFMCVTNMGMQAVQNKKALKTLFDIKTPEKQQEAAPETQQMDKKPAVAALMDQTMAPAVNVPAAEVAALQPKLRTQTSTPAVRTLPTKPEDQPSDTNTKLDGAQIEEAAFEALKNRTPTAKAKAKATGSPKKKDGAKAKASIMKKPSTSSSPNSKQLGKRQSVSFA